MYLGSMPKQPRERLPVDISFAEVIAGRTVSAINSVADIVPNTSLTNAFQQMNGEVLQIFFAGGATDVDYRVTVLTTITIGGQDTIVEDEFDVIVREE